MRTRAELKAAAKEQLVGKWGGAVLFIFLLFLLMGVAPNFLYAIPFMAFFSWAVPLLISGAFTFVLTKYFLDIKRGNAVDVGQIFDGFRGEMFVATLKLFLWMTLKVFLWSLLLIVPGIIKAYAYSQAYFILRDNPEMGTNEILKKSEAMMMGHKGEFFVLNLSFIGWSLLVGLTMGVGSLWLIPYVQVTLSNYYDDLLSEEALAPIAVEAA